MRPIDPGLSTFIGALVGGGAAVAGQLFSARAQRQVELGKAREARMDELREVLDDASLALMKGIENYDWLVAHWRPGQDLAADDVPAGELYEVRRFESRLAVRVAGQEVFAAYRAARSALWTIFSPTDGDADAQRVEFARRREQAAAEQERFNRCATVLVGAPV